MNPSLELTLRREYHEQADLHSHLQRLVSALRLSAAGRKAGAERWRAAGIRESWSTPVVLAAASGRDEDSGMRQLL